MVEATVLIAAWCAEKTLRASVESALAQEGVNLEVVISNDASTDGTHAVAQDLAQGDPRVRVVGLSQNGGASAARNAAMAVARGEWLVVLDADDAFVPGRLRRVIDFARGQQADIVCDNLQVVDEAGAASAPTPFLSGPEYDAPRLCELAHYIEANIGRPGQATLGYLKPVMRRAFLHENGLKYDPSLRNGEDFHLILACLAAGARFWITPEVGYLYTARSGSVSSRLNPDHARALRAADEAFLRAHPDLPAQAQGLMRTRIKSVANLSAAEEIMQALKARRPLSALSALTSRPQALGRVAVQTGEAIQKRLKN